MSPSKKRKERGIKNEIPQSKKTTAEKMVVLERTAATPEKIKSLIEEKIKIHGQKTKTGFTDWVETSSLRIIVYATAAIFIFCLITANNRGTKNIFLNGVQTDKITINDTHPCPDNPNCLTNWFALPYKEVRIFATFPKKSGNICLNYSGQYNDESGSSKEKNEWFSSTQMIPKSFLQRVKNIKLDEERKWLIITMDTNWKLVITFCIICGFFAWLIPELFYFSFSKGFYLEDGDYYRSKRKYR
ncbi:MAG: hypothetical protein PHE59_00150 [Patescibacteria group bacterium]|nr:hypothetical protein [Patescibacteria group bacterium]MDD5164582.1 hypothetical protein [Patescibacteria group bacterium]MDD5534337.1 hypothetical protein [Patescibacteria group bacterium]